MNPVARWRSGKQARSPNRGIGDLGSADQSPSGRLDGIAGDLGRELSTRVGRSGSSARIGRHRRASEEDRVFQLTQGFQGFAVELQCEQNCPGGGVIYAHYFATIEVDPVAPTLSDLEGSLLSGNVIRGYQTIERRRPRRRGRHQQRLGLGQRPAGRAAQGLQLRRRPGQQPQCPGHRRGRGHPLPNGSEDRTGPSTRRPIPSTTGQTRCRSAPRTSPPSATPTQPARHQRRSTWTTPAPNRRSAAAKC